MKRTLRTSTGKWECAINRSEEGRKILFKKKKRERKTHKIREKN